MQEPCSCIGGHVRVLGDFVKNRDSVGGAYSNAVRGCLERVHGGLGGSAYVARGSVVVRDFVEDSHGLFDA